MYGSHMTISIGTAAGRIKKGRKGKNECNSEEKKILNNDPYDSPRDHLYLHGHKDRYADESKQLGINGLTREIVGKPTYYCSWNEDHNNQISILNALITMCGVNSEEKIKAVSVTLTWDVLDNYANNFKDCGDFSKAAGILRSFITVMIIKEVCWLHGRKVRFRTMWVSALYDRNDRVHPIQLAYPIN